jgi:hypothetical protein
MVSRESRRVDSSSKSAGVRVRTRLRPFALKTTSPPVTNTNIDARDSTLDRALVGIATRTITHAIVSPALSSPTRR